MYDRKLIRLTGFDYSSSRYHFFTICVEDHYHSFGAIENKTMILSYQGNIAFEQWKWLGKQYPYIDLISFVIMPDHIHGIIHIDADYYNIVNTTGFHNTTGSTDTIKPHDTINSQNKTFAGIDRSI